MSASRRRRGRRTASCWSWPSSRRRRGRGTTSCRSSRPSSRAIAEHTTVGQRNLDQQPARISISKWIEHDRDFVSSLYVLELPSTLHEDAGAAHFDAPVLHPSALLRHIDLDVGMRIGPLKHSHRTRQSDSLASVKHGKGVVCRYHAESRPENDQQDNSPFFCARRLSHVYIPFQRWNWLE